MSNIQLTGTLAKIPHVEIKSVHYTVTPNGSTLSISTASCAGYHDACAALEAKGSTEITRDLRYGRAHETECQFGVLSHVCFPHLDCWGAPTQPKGS